VTVYNPRSKAFRSFRFRELQVARALQEEGFSFTEIAKALGRKSHDGIRRQLDNAYRVKRNADQVERKRLARGRRP
jgi:hypothetical protein